MDIPRTCTKCGRTIPAGEWGRFRVAWSAESLTVTVLCALHTDHQVAGEWHDTPDNDTSCTGGSND